MQTSKIITYIQLICFIMTVCLVSGCTRLRKKHRTCDIPSPEIEIFEDYCEDGTGIVKGSVFVGTPDGNVKSCSGMEITLRPDTPYVRAVFHNLAYEHEKKVPPLPPELEDATHKVTTDAGGNFIFRDVKQDKWLVIGEYKYQCDFITKKLAKWVYPVEVKDNEVIEISLSNENWLVNYPADKSHIGKGLIIGLLICILGILRSVTFI